MTFGELHDTILNEIELFCDKHGSCQTAIMVSNGFYRVLWKEARSTSLGRLFSQEGLFFYTLPVFKGGKGITVSGHKES